MNAEESLKKVNEALDDFETNKGISTFVPPGTEEELAEYLNISKDRLAKMDAEDCIYGSYLLAQYALYIQRVCNVETANLRWINRKIIEFTSDKLSSYDKYMKHENKIQLIAKENEVVSRLMKMQSYTESILDRLSFISSNVKHMADILKSIQGIRK